MDQAADVLYAGTRTDVDRAPVRQRGWSAQQYEHWLAAWATRELLAGHQNERVARARLAMRLSGAMRMTADIHVTAATAALAGEIVALGRRLERDSSPCSFWGIDQAKVQGWLDDPACALLVVQQGTSVAGIGKLLRGAAFQQHLAEVSVAVCPQHRRQGIASALLGSLEQCARQRGVELLKALIWTQNHPSRRLFESAGYVHRATLYAEFMSPQFGAIDDCVYYLSL